MKPKQSLDSVENAKPMQQQSLGDVQLQGDDNIFNVVQAEIVTLTQNKIIQISVDEIKTREFIVTSPYKGLRSFELKDADQFFGRDQFIAGLVNELERTNFVLLLGASGSGKSSVVRAGLIPWLCQKWGTEWFNLTLTPDQDPFESLYGSLLSHFKQSEVRFVRAGEVDTLSQLVTTLKRPESYWFIFIDQFEELFTTSEPEQRDRFITSLTQLCKDHARTHTLRIVATMRADFLDRFDANPANLLVAATEGHRPLITQLHPDELRLIIEQPAAQHGVVFEKGLVEEIIKDVQGQAGYLPLLQYTLDMLWKTEVSDGGIHDRTLNIQSYRNIGGVRGALQQRVDEIYQQLSPSGQLAAQRIFLKLVGIGGNTTSETDWKPVRKRESRSQFRDPLEQAVLTELIDANLLVSDAPIANNAIGATVEIAHEILLTSWKQLQDWIRANREAIALRNRLNDDVAQWQLTHLNDELWSGLKLEKATELKDDPTFNQMLGGFSPIAVEFIEASVSLRTRIADEKEAQYQQELAQAEKALKTAQKNRRNAIMGGFAMFTLALFAGSQMRKAEIQQVQTSIEFSNRSLNSNQRLDADIASIRAARRPRNRLWRYLVLDKQTRSSVTDQLEETAIALQGQERARLDNFTGKVHDIVINNNGVLQLATISTDDDTLHLWKAADSNFEKLESPSDRISQVKFSNNGAQLAIVKKNGTAHLWNVAESELQALNSPLGQVSKVVFNHDDSQLAMVGENGNISLWDIASKQPIELKNLPDKISEVVFNHDSSQLAMVGENGTAYLLNTADNKLQEIKSPLGQISKVVFNHDGSQLATLEKYGTVRLWDISNGSIADKQPQELRGLQDYINTIAFSLDGLLFTGSVDGTVRLWGKDGRALKEFKGHQRLVIGVAFKKGLEQFFTSGVDGTVRLWDTTRKPGAQGEDNLGHNELLSIQCDWVRDYLTSKPNIEKRDRHLCDDIASYISPAEPSVPIAPVIPNDSTVDRLTIIHTRQGDISSGKSTITVAYKTWGGSNWTASINSQGEFTHTAQGANSSHNATIINYISWDGSEWTATIDPVSKVFTHTRRGATSSHTDTILNYITWDGSAWTMRLEEL